MVASGQSRLAGEAGLVGLAVQVVDVLLPQRVEEGPEIITWFLTV